MKQYDENYENPNYLELQKEFIAEYESTMNPQNLLNIAKHCNTFALYAISNYIQSRKRYFQKIEKKTEDMKNEIVFIEKMQSKITPIFLKKWLENCPDRRIIFNFISAVDFDDKQKQLVNETISKIHAIGYIKHFIDNVEFADKEYIEKAIKAGNDYCLKYEYGIQFPEARKEIIKSMKQQATKSPHSGIIKQYVDELAEMKNNPPQEEPRML